MIKVNGVEIKPTIFPDKTSQVWKLPEFDSKYCIVTWNFESEAEIIHLAQLKQLLDLQYKKINLNVRYLPYARQDKPISNESTFALNSFALLLNAMCFNTVYIFDPHSKIATDLIINSIAYNPFEEILSTLNATESISCFPDKGASTRYPDFLVADSVICDKNRDQLTGEILGLKTDNHILPLKYLIIDDICDGGRTFIETAKVLYAGGALEVNLYVSHGIFSKGLEVLREAGIKRIFTKDGEIL